MPQYSKTTWVDGTAPAISAANLNKLEQGVFDSFRQDGSTTMSAQLVTIAGTAGTPAIAPTGDSNTGIFFPAADTIAFGEGGTEVMRINSSGFVGINNQTPSANLSVKAASDQIAAQFIAYDGSTGSALQFRNNTNASETALIWSHNTDGLILKSASGAVRLRTGSTDGLVMNSSGNVGIGTTAPASLLGVHGSPQATSGAIITTRDTSATGSNTTFGGITFVSSPATDFSIGKISENATSALGFRNANTGAEYMRITSAGNVGIGTTNIPALLSVGSTAGGKIGITSNQTTGSSGSPKNLDLSFYGYLDTERARIRAIEQSFSTFESYLSFWTHNNTTLGEKMRLNENGYLLIGYTTSNGAYPLQVNGQIFATSSTIATSDGRYKKDVVSLDGALDIVAALNPVQFNWKEHPVHKFNTEVPTIGFIAQEVAEVLKDKAYLTSVIKKSECTWETETGETVEREVTRDIETQVEREVIEEVDGEEVTRTVTETVIEQVTEIVNEPVKEVHTEEFYGIAESNMIAILTKAIQELNAKVEALEAQLAK